MSPAEKTLSSQTTGEVRAPRPRRWRGALMLSGKLAVASVLIGYLVASDRIDWRRLGDIQSWAWFGLGQLLVGVVVAATALRWHLLLLAQGIDSLRGGYRSTFVLSTIGFFFNQFVPGSTGGDLVKAYYIAVEHPRHRAAAVTTVLLDRVVGLMVMMGLGAIAMAIEWAWIRSDPSLLALAWMVVAILIGFCLASLVFFNERLRASAALQRVARKLPVHRVFHKVQRAVYAYKFRPRVVLGAVLLSALVQGALVLANGCFYRALGGDALSLANFFFIVPIAHLAMAVPISPPGGLGVSEWIYTDLFRRAGSPDGGLVALHQRLSFYLWSLLGLAFYLRRKRRVDEAIALGQAQSESEEA